MIINHRTIPDNKLVMKLWIYRTCLNGLSLVCICFLCQSCHNPKPISKDKGDFIGVWQAYSGFKVEIKASGTADVYEYNLPQNSDNIKLIIGVTPQYAMDMLVGFGSDSILIISKPTVRAREYRIDRNPFLDGDTMKMVLNGVVLIKQK